MPPDNNAQGLYQYISSLTRSVRYCPGTGSHTLCRGRRAVDPAHKHPEGALCAAGGFYPPLQLRRQSRRRVDMIVAPYSGLYHPSRYLRKSGVSGGFYPPLQGVCIKCSCLNVFIDFYERMWYNIFILQVPPIHRSEQNLDVRVGIMPTIHPIYRRNNL